MQNKLYTIGHSTYKVDKFISILKMFQIDTIVDIRSIPYSKYTPNYNKENIHQFLIKQNLKYIYMGDELGGKDIGDINKRWLNKTFLQGIARLKNGINKKHNIALMCAEKNPIDCHRFRLIGEYLNTQDINTFHIVPTEESKYESILHQNFNKKKTVQQKTLFNLS